MNLSLQDRSEELHAFSIDRDSVQQARLDLIGRQRRSLYPWRGQFSPGLVDVLLEAHAVEGKAILDPFVGSGTTLFESSRRSLECYGAEVNPAAIQLARMARFCMLPGEQRRDVCQSAIELFERYFASLLPASLLRPRREGESNDAVDCARKMLEATGDNTALYDFLASSVMLAMGDGDLLAAEKLENALCRNAAVVRELPLTTKGVTACLSDARRLSLPSDHVDLVITSPPYINVFNYHQNYRKAVELMGWGVLKAARSEIGSNRKHRSNRFLTVIQYCMDVAQVLHETRRVLRPDGVAIFVVGRESRVRGLPFNNGHLLALLAVSGGGFRLDRWQERRFANRFGVTICEDILSLHPSGHACGDPVSLGREVGVMALRGVLDLVLHISNDL